MTTINAIDIGFIYTKSIINGKKVIFKSVVGDGKTQRFGSLSMNKSNPDEVNNIITNYKKKDGEIEKNFVSDLAIKQSEIILHSLKTDRFNSKATDVIIQSALGIGGANGDNEVIVSGLPVSHYTKYLFDIKKLFLDTGSKIHNFDVEYNGINKKGFVKFTKGEFIPQPFGVFLDKILDDNGEIRDKVFATKTVAVIDIGFGTTDVFVTSDLETIERLTFSLPIAMNTAYSLISEKIEEKHGVVVSFYDIETIVKTKIFKRNGLSYDVSKLIDWAFEILANQLTGEIINRWNRNDASGGIDNIILAGGGGIALNKYFQMDFNNIELAKDTQWAVANGYNKWGIRHYKMEESTK